MAASIIKFDENSQPMSRVTAGLRMIRDGVELLRQARDIEIAMIDGDANAPANFDVLRIACGFQQGDYATADAAAQASYLELESLYAKLTRPSGQGDATGAALAQACAKHGV